jgi:hypothetical protein
MPLTDIVKGTEIKLTLTVKNDAGELTDVDDIVLTVKDAVGNTTVLPMNGSTNPSTGVYIFQFTPTDSGKHLYKVETDTPSVVYEGDFYVKSSSF